MDTTLLSELFDNWFIRICLILIAGAIVQIIVRKTIGKVVAQAVRRDHHYSREEEQKREDTLSSMFTKLSGLAVWVIVVIIVLSELQIDFAALITGAGLVGVIVGLGAQAAIKDFLAGAFIILENQFRVGDIVNLHTAAGEIAGVVEELTVRITKLRDLDGKLHFIPNGSIDVVSNMTFEYAGINIDIGVDYSSDIDKVEKVMNEVGESMANEETWSDKIHEPIQFLRVDDFGDSQITIKALGRVVPPHQWEVAGEYRRRLKKAFDKSKITIPFPQLVVHKEK